MIVGVLIAVVLLFVGLPWWAAIGAGIAYAVIAFVITPRSAYVGGLFGPRPRPGEVPGPGSTREIDLTPEIIRSMSAQWRPIAQSEGRDFGVNVVDAAFGNIGWRQGQYAEITVQLPDDYRQAALVRGKALGMAVAMFARSSDDMREARLQFMGRDGKRVASSIVDMSAAGPETVIDDSGPAAYAAAHTRTREFD